MISAHNTAPEGKIMYENGMLKKGKYCVDVRWYVRNLIYFMCYRFQSFFPAEKNLDLRLST
jgi:hypothetical protein